jgi:hypothetical protein
MSDPIDIGGLREEIERALGGKDSRGVTGEWSASRGRGRVYRGAPFRFEGKDWVVVRGQQRPAAAQLLDSTAWFKLQTGAKHAVALLDPEKKKPHHDPAQDAFRLKYQAAVWHGLGIVAMVTEQRGAWQWEPGVRPTLRGLDDLARRVREEIAAQYSQDSSRWIKVVRDKDSKAAEALVSEAVAAALAPQYAQANSKDRAFKAVWRDAVADGLWVGRQGEPRIALEVKVAEDVGAPFCQAFDDLGVFDAVMYVRLASAKTRKELARREGLEELKADVQRKVPVRFIEHPEHAQP